MLSVIGIRVGTGQNRFYFREAQHFILTKIPVLKIQDFTQTVEYSFKPHSSPVFHSSNPHHFRYKTGLQTQVNSNFAFFPDRITKDHKGQKK